jgi:hypothetical protein
MLMPIKYVFVLMPVIIASIGFNGPVTAATGGGGRLISIQGKAYFHLSIVTSMSMI